MIVCIDRCRMTAGERSHSVSTTDADVVRRQTRRSLRAVFGRLLENGAVPKLIILTVCLCAVYLLLRLTVDLLDVDRLSSFGLFAVYVDTVSTLVNATNSDVLASAAAYNSIMMPSYSELIHTQIVNLHQLVDHFNNGTSLTHSLTPSVE